MRWAQLQAAGWLRLESLSRGHFNNEVKQGEQLLPASLAGAPPVGNEGLLFTSQDQKREMYSESTVGRREGRNTPESWQVSSSLRVTCENEPIILQCWLRLGWRFLSQSRGLIPKRGCDAWLCVHVFWGALTRPTSWQPKLASGPWHKHVKMLNIPNSTGWYDRPGD